MTDASERRDDLLRRLLLEEIDRSSPEVERLLADDPDLAKRLEDVDRMLATVRGAGELEREILEAARLEATPPGLDRVAPVLAQELPASRRSTWAILGGILVAAALMIATWLFVRDAEPDGFPDSGPKFLDGGGEHPGSEGLELEHEEAMSGFGHFRWRYERDGVRFRLRISDPRSDPPALLRDEVTIERSWSPSLPECEDWPEYVRWEIVVLDGSGKELARAAGDARRSP